MHHFNDRKLTCAITYTNLHNTHTTGYFCGCLTRLGWLYFLLSVGFRYEKKKSFLVPVTTFSLPVVLSLPPQGDSLSGTKAKINSLSCF